MNEKLYMFNPWQLSKWSEEQIADQVGSLLNGYNNEAEAMYDLALNVEKLANVTYLYGEMIARLTKKVTLKKSVTDTKEAENIYFERKKWAQTNNEKPPAMSYFEAQAKKIVKEDREEQAELEAKLMRFKKAYESTENIMNAEKKKMEAVKFEDQGLYR